MTIEKFQQLVSVHAMDIDEVDKSILLVRTYTGKSQEQIDRMKANYFNKLCKKILQEFENQSKLMNDEKPKNIIRANGRWYQLVYDVTTAGKYVEATTFSGDIIGNLHKIIATMAIPLKLTIRGLKPTEREHEAIANDMLQADFKHAYHAAVFFYAVYSLSMHSLVLCSADNQITMAKKLELVRSLTEPLGGFTMPKWFQTLSVAQ